MALTLGRPGRPSRLSTDVPQAVTLKAMMLGVPDFIREVETLDEHGIVHSPPPLEPGDLVATSVDVWRVDVVVPPTSRPRPVEPVLALRVVVGQGVATPEV